jgi:hypothetical protein
MKEREMMRARSLFFAGQLACALMFSSGVVAVEDEPYVITPATFVLENGAFQSVYPTIESAKAAALGDSTNRTLRQIAEFLFINNPCEDTFNYSLYMTDRRFRHVSVQKDGAEDLDAKILAQVTALDQPSKPFDIDAVYDAKNPSPETVEDQLLAKLYADLLTFSYKRYADCEPIPLGIIFKSGGYKSFERNDAGTPLVGKRFHDAAVIEATRVTREQAKARGDEKLAAKGVPNTFTALNSAIAAATLIAGDKVIMFDGKAAHIYRADENRDIPGIGRQFKNLGEYVTALKNAKPANGMTILALVVGNKGAVPISTPTK